MCLKTIVSFEAEMELWMRRVKSGKLVGFSILNAFAKDKNIDLTEVVPIFLEYLTAFATELDRHTKAQPGRAEGAQAPALAISIFMFIFLVFQQLGRSRSGALQNVLWQYHKA